jgi:hypothetical protein
MRIWFTYVLFLIGSSLTAQLSSAIISKVDTVEVGQLFSVQLRITKPLNTTFKAINLSPLHNPTTVINSLYTADDNGVYPSPDFEILEPNLGASANNPDIVGYNKLKWIEDKSLGKSYFEAKVDYLFWDPGVYKLRGVDFITTDSTTQVLELEGTAIFVRPPEMDIDTTKQIPVNPIKDIIREERSWRDFLPYLLAFLIAITAFYLSLRYRRNKKKNLDLDFEEEEVYVAPHVKALEKLETLRKEELWQKGEIKEYQSRLTNIIREYIDGRYKIPAQEMSTEEITYGLKSNRAFDNRYETQLIEILTMADLIKFAKAKPPADIHDRFMNTAVDFVNKTKSEGLNEALGASIINSTGEEE